MPNRSGLFRDPGAMGDVTVILQAIQRGEQPAEELIPLVYDELRLLAARRLGHELPGQTIQATELVHEAYLRLVASESQTWENRRHFFGAAAEAMRRIMIERARKRHRLKRGGNAARVDFEAIEVPAAMPDENLLALDEALGQLAAADEPAATLVKLRFFVGLTHGQAAEALGVSRRTADDLWAFAKAWLYRVVKQDLNE